MCPQKIILNLGVRTANKMKLGFEARSQNTRIVKFIRQLLLSGNKQLGVEEEYLLIIYFPDCINILRSSNMLTNGLRLKSLCKLITN